MENIFQSPQKIRDILILVYHMRCQYCLKKWPRAELVVEHIVPKSKGGQDSLHNYTLACKICNVRKAALLLRESGISLLVALSENKSSKILKILQERRSSQAPRQSPTHLPGLHNPEPLMIENLIIQDESSSGNVDARDIFMKPTYCRILLNLYGYAEYENLLPDPIFEKISFTLNANMIRNLISPFGLNKIDFIDFLGNLRCLYIKLPPGRKYQLFSLVDFRIEEYLEDTIIPLNLAVLPEEIKNHLCRIAMTLPQDKRYVIDYSKWSAD